MLIAEPSYHLSQTARATKRSAMRELLKHAADPAIISFATGLPPSEALPVAGLRASMDAAFADARTLQYGPPSSALREWIAALMGQRGVDCNADNILITNGSQQGLSILARLFLDAGDSAVTEAVTFTGIAKAMQGQHATLRTVPTNLADGIDTDALEAAFAQTPHPRLAAVIPDFHNPLGVSLSSEKRQRIAQLAAHYRVPIIEDDPYALLRFEGEMLPPVKAYDEAQMVFYLGSFSKMLAPALRLGWIVLPTHLLPTATALREMLDLESSQLMQAAVANFVTAGLLDSHLVRLRPLLRERRDAMLAALARHFGALATWTRPEGGLFVWVTLNDEAIDTLAVVQAALAAGVVYVPGSVFALDGGYGNTLRLNFGNLTPDQIDIGLARLAALFRS